MSKNGPSVIVLFICISCFNGCYQLHERCCPKSVFGMIFVVVILKSQVDAISQPQKFLHDRNSEKYSAWSMIALHRWLQKVLDPFSPPQKPYLTRGVWLHQSDCDENQTDVTIPYNKLSTLTKWEVSFKWNRKNKSLKSKTTIAYMTPAPRDHYGEWRVDPPDEKAWDMDRSRCQFWQRLALAIMPTLIHEQRALLCYIWSSNHFWARHFVIGRIPQNCFDFLFHSRVFHLP